MTSVKIESSPLNKVVTKVQDCNLMVWCKLCQGPTYVISIDGELTIAELNSISIAHIFSPDHIRNERS